MWDVKGARHPTPEDEPLRDELYSVEQLNRHARSLAGSHRLAERQRGPDRLLPRLLANAKLLSEAYGLISDAVRRGRRITPAAEWLVDNYHLIEEQVTIARRHLPKGYSRELPRLTNGPSAGYPRVYALAIELISHVDGRVDEESLRVFVTSYQSASSLRLGELWAIPIMLRLGLVENLRRVVARVAAGRRDRERATHWIDRMLAVAVTAPANVVLVLAEMIRENPHLSTAFVSEFATRAQAGGPPVIFPMTWLEHRVAEQGETIESVFQQASQSQAADQVSIGNSIGSLRFLGAMEWRNFVESMSSVEHILRTDPTGTYPKMDFATRDEYRHAVEDIARRGKLDEEAVAHRAIELAKQNIQVPPTAPMPNHDADLPAAAPDNRTSHVGHFLIGKGRPVLEAAAGMNGTLRDLARRIGRRFPLVLYAGSVVLATSLMTGLLLVWSWHHGLATWALVGLGATACICTRQVAVALANWGAMRLVHPRILPRMDFTNGIPADQLTIASVPTIISDAREIDDVVEALEVRYLANRDRNLIFSLLTDFPDAATETTPGDEAVLLRVRQAMEALIAKYVDGQFILLHRQRRWNPREAVWMGWERKRGKLENLNDALRGNLQPFDTIVGSVGSLGSVRYVIVLDSDTQLPRDAARELVGTMAHPLNRPRFDAGLGRVTDGYGILQPRIGITMPSANRSPFSRLFAGEPGIDPYTRAVSDVYQDVFGEGSFVGKGIYDVDAFRRAIGGRLPENRVLSHDLLESAYVRSGLVTDVQLFEDFPSSYPADMSRRYRWIRGDWQVVRWALPRVPGPGGRRVRNPISCLSRWKILDNAGRSMTPVAMLALLLLGWCLPGAAVALTMVVLACLLLPAVLTGAAAISRRPSDLPLFYHARTTGHSMLRQSLQDGFGLACLPYEAFISAKAVARTGVRILITGRHLLEWRTAREAQRTSSTSILALYGLMWTPPLTAAICALALACLQPRALVVAAPILLLWFVAPAIAFRLSRPTRAERPPLSRDDAEFLGVIARRTWRFFETFGGPEDNHLPPDNFQADPPRGIAHRTSPTNIGLGLLANLAACDFGFITVTHMIERVTGALASLDRLQRHRGHFCNWYDTATLETLQPAYISTVDSGNLAGHLLILAAGLDEAQGQDIFRPSVTFRGLGATLDQLALVAQDATAGPAAELETLAKLRAQLRTSTEHPLSSRDLLRRVGQAVGPLRAALDTQPSTELKWWAESLDRQCREAATELDELLPELTTARRTTAAAPDDINHAAHQPGERRSLTDVAHFEIDPLLPVSTGPMTPAGDDASGDLHARLFAASELAAKRLSDLRDLATRCRELADIDYAFLFDKERQLLSIGYSIAARRLDGGFYDLLASEARVASYVAIAQGKLPEEHWFRLGRSLTNVGSGRALLSWSGSMFEYLMPLLIMPTYAQTLLDETYRAVVKRQIEYGRERNVPWGISESGYLKIDAQLNYQYRAFGLPGLGFKRGLADDLVIAPYASALALMVDAASACANLRRLARDGLLSAYGFFEAVDYTPSRVPRGRESATVSSYMAHHQGMLFLSIAYALLDRPMQRRFSADLSLRSANLLLQERIPKAPAILPHPADGAGPRGAPADTGDNFRVFRTPQTAVPEVQLLSNGRYHVAVTAAGGGYSRWRDLAITRWREDATRDCWGTFCYLRDVETGDFWSAGQHPTTRTPATFEAVFSQGRAELRRRDGDIATHVEISVSPEDDVELRCICISNVGRHARTIELTSYAEVVLATPAADAAHPAFSNLFVETAIVESRQAILCTRRPRSAEEHPPWMLHLMTVHGETARPTSYETDRAAFIGRGRTSADPAAMHIPTLANGAGAVLDPIVAIRNTVVIGPDETVKIQVVTGAAATREQAAALVEKYHDRHLSNRVFELAWTHSQVISRQLDATDADVQLYGRMASSILSANPSLRAPASVIARNRRGQSGLWAYGISGDLPIVLVRIGQAANIALVHQLVQAHAFWRLHGLAVDLVIWNEDLSGYRQVLQDLISGVVASRSESSLLDRPAGIFIRRLEQISEEDKVLMQSASRIIISDASGTLAEQMDRSPPLLPALPAFRPVRNDRADRSAPPASADRPPASADRPPADLLAFNGLGGFTRDGREYLITTTPDSPTPAPWVNVIANPWFGTVVSESGCAYTWCENAHSFRLTPWNDDPVVDPSGEAFYLRDEDTGRFWSPSPLPARGPMPYTTRHGFGYSVFEYADDGIASAMSTFVATDAPVKFVVIRVRNTSGRSRRLSVTAFLELALGERREAQSPHIVTEVDPKTGAILARNSYNTEFAERVVFFDSSESRRTLTGDRGEFLGRNGHPSDPACMHRVRLSGRTGAALDACAAIQVSVDLADGQEREIAFTFGAGRDLADARVLINRFRGTDAARAALDQVSQFWNRTLGAVHVETPDASVNVLANGWLLYQVLASRVWGRSGFYQSGGAFGFRDQLQDVMSLIHAQPAVFRAQLLRCAGRQFREGDVQHWWHPPLGRGVRTRISDDFLWLPFAACRYVKAIGDTGILDERIPFLTGRALLPGEDSSYDLPGRSDESATLYSHCVLAIRHGLRFGQHGLPLMDGGDWNDGMNLVGERGRGESVWLAFFLCDVLTQFEVLARGRGDETTAKLCADSAAELQRNIEAHGWDGDWYRRAYFDDGQPLGSTQNMECRIDSIPQSWAVLSRAADPDRARRAMEAVNEKLVRRDIRIIQLFEPPFDRSPLNPGYVKGYLPGVRENGGQYTHAAIWTVMAFAATGDAARTWELFQLINPVRHSDTEAAMATYKVEPYVVAADVYANPQHAGRGGWTWYTGSAGWMYRLITESILGLRLEVDTLSFSPCIPPDWTTFKIHYRFHETFYHITFRKLGPSNEVTRLSSNGADQPERSVRLYNDFQEHFVDVDIGSPAPK